MNLLYLSSPGGGLDTSVRVLASAFAKMGHRVSVLYIHLPGQLNSASQGLDGCRVYHASIGNWHYYLSRATFEKTSLPALVRTLEYTRTLSQTVAKLAADQRIDLIEVPEVFTFPRWLGGMPCIMRLHASAWMCRRMYNEWSPWSDGLETKLEELALHRANGISSPSRAVANYISATCHLDSRQIEIIPYPIDTSRFVPGQACVNPPCILFVGRIEKRKGADVLIRAMPLVWEKYPDCRLVLAGSVGNELKDQVERVDIRIRFLGLLLREELIQWYQYASIFAAPSLWDNSPNTIYEAMACGTPVVATRVGGIPELVDDGVTGILVPPRDPNALADAIIRLLGDPARRERMGQCSRAKAEAEYPVDKIVARHLSFYDRIQKRES